MKKFLVIVVLGLLISGNAYADNFKIGQIIKNEFRFSKKVSFPLGPGEWEVIDRDIWAFGPMKVRLITIAQIENNELVAIREFQEGNLSGGYQYYLNIAVLEYLYKNKYDGCYERPEYTLLKTYTKGNTHNCLVVRHIDPYKEIFTPDDPESYSARAPIKFFVRNNNLKLPNSALYSYHAYFSRMVSNYLYTAVYIDSPKKFGAPKNNSKGEETSEYHPFNIDKYPKHKKIMNNFIEISSSRHIEFEEIVNAKKKDKLKFVNISPNSNKIKKNKIINIEQIKKLHDLYKDGILTKEEFEKAKKKLLN